MPRSLSHARCWPLVLGLLVPWGAAASGATPPGADVESVRAYALAHSPVLAAATLDADAARAAVLPSGALPDPTLSVALRDASPVLRPDDARVDRGNLVQWRQSIPLWGKRGLAREVASADADRAAAERDAAARRLLADVEATYARYWESGQALAVLERRLSLVEAVEAVAGVRYAVGLAAQQDAIRAQVLRTSLVAERLARSAARDEAAALLNALLGRPADAALAAPRGVPSLPVRWTTLDAARAALAPASQPELASRAFAVAAAERSAELQRRRRRPDVTFGVGAMQEGGGIGGLELMLEVEIPLQQRVRREREREADLRAEAARLRSRAATVDLDARLAGALAQWSAAGARRRLAETTLAVQSDANYRSALAGYQAGEVDFATVLDALDAWQGAELVRLAAQRDELVAAAAVRAIEGAP